MARPAQIRSDIATILVVVKAMLVAGTGLDASRVRDTVEDDWNDLPALDGPQDLWLRLAEEVPEAEFFRGSGRLDRRVRRTLRVTIRTRKLLDSVAQATTLLTAATGGHLALEDAVVKSLDDQHVFAGNDAAADQLTFDPMEMTRIDPPTRDRKKRDWAGSVLSCQVPYRRKCTDAT